MLNSRLSRTQQRPIRRRRAGPTRLPDDQGAPPGGRPRQAVPVSGADPFRVAGDVEPGKGTVLARSLQDHSGAPSHAEPFAERPMAKHSWLPLLAAPIAAVLTLGWGS